MRTLFITLAAAILAAAPSLAQENAMAPPTAPDQTGYADVNGISLYYEVRGEGGTPLVLLHGGVVPGPETFGASFPVFAEGRQVISVDLQGHGRTKDIDRPFSVAAMADDVAGLIRHLGIAEADILGYSLGGHVALHVAFRHPDLVRKLVLVSVSFRRDGSFPEVLAAFDAMNAEAGAMMAQSPFAQIYPDVDWRSLFGKTGAMLREDFDWSDEVRAIGAPVMLVYGDADSISTAHMAEFYALLGGGIRDAGLDGSGRPRGRLAIVPGKTHYAMFTDDTVARLVVPFLDAPMPGG